MRVSFATTWDSKCGVANYSRSLVTALKKHADVEVVSLDPENMTSPVRLAGALNAGDIAHIQHQYPFFGGMAFHRNWLRHILRRLVVPLVVTVHELDLGESDSPLVRTYKRWFNRSLFNAMEVDRILVHTDEYQEKLEGLGIETDRIEVIPMGVPELPPPPIASRIAKVRLGLTGKKVVTIFGFVVRRKGYEVALDSLRKWPPDTVLLIAGGPHPGDHTGYFDGLKERIASSGLSERVLVSGYLPEDDIPTIMAATDLVLAPFTSMSSSWSIMHAMAYGKPIVASDLRPAREINSRLPCLSLFKVADQFDLAEKVCELMEDKRKYDIAVSAVKAYADMWSVDRAAEDTLAIYNQLLKDMESCAQSSLE